MFNDLQRQEVQQVWVIVQFQFNAYIPDSSSMQNPNDQLWGFRTRLICLEGPHPWDLVHTATSQVAHETCHGPQPND